ncbi:MAG: hypothetical protein E5V75_15155 [Mesorhizobium sp.]|nr:MAG: hypothetical protein E5V75_15155 [Mesorhizobium sp.]
MSPKSAQRFWENDMHQNKDLKRVARIRFSATRFNGQPQRRAGSRAAFSLSSGCEGERHGHADASHTRPWHNHPAGIGLLCAAFVTAQGAAFRQQCRRSSFGMSRPPPVGLLIWKTVSDKR